MVRIFLLLVLRCIGALVLAACALVGAAGASRELSRPAKHTRIVYHFDARNDAAALDEARQVFRHRLKEMEASEVKVERSGASELIVEFRPLKPDPFDPDGEMARTLSARGELRFYIHPKLDKYKARAEEVLVSETRFFDWMNDPANEQVSLDVYNELTPAQGGPLAGFLWYTDRPGEKGDVLPRKQRHKILLSVPEPKWNFTSKDLENISKSKDSHGHPAFSFQMKPKSVVPFGDFTAAHAKEDLAVVFDGEIVLYTTINERLPGQGQIYGNFSDSKVNFMVRILRSGELPSRPVLVSREEIAAMRDPRWIALAVGGVVLGCSAIWLFVHAWRSVKREAGALRTKAVESDGDWSSSGGLKP